VRGKTYANLGNAIQHYDRERHLRRAVWVAVVGVVVYTEPPERVFDRALARIASAECAASRTAVDLHGRGRIRSQHVGNRYQSISRQGRTVIFQRAQQPRPLC
jgi:hypothetical protein